MGFQHGTGYIIRLHFVILILSDIHDLHIRIICYIIFKAADTVGMRSGIKETCNDTGLAGRTGEKLHQVCCSLPAQIEIIAHIAQAGSIIKQVCVHRHNRNVPRLNLSEDIRKSRLDGRLDEKTADPHFQQFIDLTDLRLSGEDGSLYDHINSIRLEFICRLQDPLIQLLIKRIVGLNDNASDLQIPLFNGQRFPGSVRAVLHFLYYFENPLPGFIIHITAVVDNPLNSCPGDSCNLCYLCLSNHNPYLLFRCLCQSCFCLPASHSLLKH